MRGEEHQKKYACILCQKIVKSSQLLERKSIVQFGDDQIHSCVGGACDDYIIHINENKDEAATIIVNEQRWITFGLCETKRDQSFG